MRGVLLEVQSPGLQRVDGFTLRTDAGQVVSETKFTNFDNYTQLTVTVSSGANNVLDLYAGFWANGDTWLQLDDVSVVAQ